ncbi:uncharacterized protein LOC121420239 [Lytechinus variegatus]|uniref:uncharacterized protein LOC121420239 n=1 Tax=Lytechinus variegatus TaxID=7654 RepID=UPI001BB147DC|nr:uncharacterized protein LOC121420239 [Lytechinus variegatus]XP_041470741.1 uncharacterized protein LOC121420239 [Lytechinus variegatus]
MDTSLDTEAPVPRKKKTYKKKNDPNRNGSDVRRSSRTRARRNARDPVSDSEPWNGKQKCIRWNTLEKQLLLRALKEKTAIAQFNYLAIKRHVKTKKKSDVEIYLKNLRKKAIKTKIESMKLKSPIEIWNNLMTHFGDQDKEAWKAMSKVMIMASVERTVNSEEIKCDEFKPCRIYRYLSDLFKSKHPTKLTPLESQVILDCFENMLEVLKESEIRDKAAFLRPQYFNLFNKAFTGGTDYSNEDSLSLVYANMASSQRGTNDPGPSRVEPGTEESVPTADQAIDLSNPGTSRTEAGTSEPSFEPDPATSGTERTSHVGKQNDISQRNKASWRGGKDRSTEVRILNPLGIPVEMLEFKPRDDERYSNKRWTYLPETDSSDSGDSSGDDDDGEDVDRIRKREKWKSSRPGTTGTAEADAENSAGVGTGELNGIQEMTDLVDADQYAFVTEEDFAKKGEVYLQALKEVHADSDDRLSGNQAIDSDQYVFVSKHDLAIQEENSVKSLDETRREENSEFVQTIEQHDDILSTANKADGGLESASAELSCAPSGDGQLEEDRNENGSKNVVEGPDIDQTDDVDDIGQSVLMDDLDSDIDSDQSEDNEFDTSLFDGEVHGLNGSGPTEVNGSTNFTPSKLGASPSQRTKRDYLLQPVSTQVKRDTVSPLPAGNNQSPAAIDKNRQDELSSDCRDDIDILTAVSLVRNKSLVSHPSQEKVNGRVPNHQIESVASSPRRIDDDTILPGGSETPGIEKSEPVQFDHDEENPEIAHYFQESPDHSTQNTIPLAKALSKGMVSNQKSDDQLLTIDVSQLGPDSNIVIPSYLLPGGILTIRSPEVPFMRIQRSDPSPLVQIGTDAADANIALDTGDQAQSDESPMDQSAEDNVPEDSGPGSDVDSPSEDDMSQTEYVIASDKPSKESENLCEVHVIANHFVKSQDQGEVPQEISSKMQDVTVKQETSRNQSTIPKKSGTYTRLARAQAEDGSDVEEQSFLDFLSSQKSMFDGRMESTPKSHPLQDRGIENFEEGEPDVHVQAAPNVNIPINKAGKSSKFKTSQHASSDMLLDMKHKGPSESETRLTVPGKPVNTAADVGQSSTSSDLHSGQKRKRGRPPKPRPPVIEKSTLASKLQEDTAKVSPGAKRKRGRPRKNDTGVPSGVLDIENDEKNDVNLSAVDSDTERTGKRKSGRPKKLPMSDIALNQSTENRNYLSEENSDSESKRKRKGVQPHTKALANSSDWQVTQLLVDDDIYTGWIEIDSQTETTEKRKRGRSASEVQESTSEEEKSSPVMTPYINRTKDALGSETGTSTKVKRKRGRPRKYSLLSSFENLQESPVMPVSREETPKRLETGSRTMNEEKKKRGRPRKDLSSSAVNLPERLVLPLNSEKIHKQCETKSDTDNREKKKRGRPRKDSLLSSMKNLQDTPVRPSHTGNEIGQTGLGISLSAKKSETRKGVRLVTIKTEESRESHDDLLGWINATQSIGTEALNEQSDIVISSESEEFSNAGQTSKEFTPYQSNKSIPYLENRDKQKPGTNSEAKVLRTDSLFSVFTKAESVDVEERGSDRLTELRGSPLNGESKEKSGRCAQDVDVRVEVEKRKRGRPRKSPNANSLANSPKTVVAPALVEVKQKCDNVSSTIPSQSYEGAKHGDHIETSSFSAGKAPEEKETSRQGTNPDEASANLASNVDGGLMMKNVHRPTKEMTSNPSKELSYPLWTQSGKVVCVYNVGDSKTIVGTVQLENPNKASRYRKILPAPPKSGEGNSNPAPFQPPNHQRQIKTTQSHLQEAGEQGTRDHLKGSKSGSTYAGGAKDTTNKAGKKSANVFIKSEIVTQDEVNSEEGSSCKPGKTDANIGLKVLEKRKRGRPPKSANTLAQDRGACYTELIDDTLFEGSATDPHRFDTQQSRGKVNYAEGETGRRGVERRGSPQKRSRFGSPLKETSQTNALQTTDAGTKTVDQKLSGVRKQVSLDRYLSAQESEASKSQGKATKGILKKRKKQSPLKVNVGQELAKKRQKGFESTRLSEASPVKKRLSPRKKPVTNTLPESHSPFGKPKKRVSFEDAIDLVNTLGERGVVENDLFHTDIVQHTAMKEVMKIVKSVGVKREVVAEPSKKSIFFSIKKS